MCPQGQGGHERPHEPEPPRGGPVPRGLRRITTPRIKAGGV
jgi:hypothetical protein